MRNVYVEVEYVGSPNQTRTFSITPDGTNEGLLMSPLIFSTNVRTWVQRENTSSGLNTIRVANADGALDSFVDEQFVSFTISEDVNGTTTQLAYGLIDRAISTSKYIEFKVKDVLKQLEIPLQNELFPDEETSDTGSGTNTYYALEGQPRPISLGRPFSVKPVLAKRSNNEYHVLDEQANSITDVYDNGVSVSHTDHTKGFTLATDPVGTILADVRGPDVGGTSNIRKLDDLVDWVMDKHSITNYSTSDLSDIDTDKNYSYLYYQDNTQNNTIAQVLKFWLDSCLGWFYADSDGDIRFGYLQEPAVSADVEISEYEVVGGLQPFDDTAPNITNQLGGNRNYYVYNSDEIASGATAQNKIDLAQKYRAIYTGANTLDSFYQSQPEPFDSYIQGNTYIESEIDGLTSLYSQKRKFYPFNSTVDAQIGQTVKLTYPRYGLDSGVNLLVVGREIDFITNTYKLTLWG